MISVEHLVLDSGPLLKGSFPEHLGKKFYVVPDVLGEIKDKASQAYISQLPFELIVKQPTEEAYKAGRNYLKILKKVVAFSRKTGDYASLSTTDLKVLALTWTLEKQIHSSVEHLNSEPRKIKDPLHKKPSKTEALSDSLSKLKVTQSTKKDLDLEWITPQNISEIKNADEKGVEEDEEGISVACMTTDFAIQNVLLQMNMKLISMQGLRIKKVKTWVLRCHACYKVTQSLDKQFCPSCGNATLLRTSASVDSKGNMTLYLKKNFQYNNRGTQFSIPESKGGKKHSNMILREDQKEYQKSFNAWKRQKDSLDYFDLDTVPLESMSQPKGMKPVIGHGRKNVNQVRRNRK